MHARSNIICTGAPTGGLGFKAYNKAFEYEPSRSTCGWLKHNRWLPQVLMVGTLTVPQLALVMHKNSLPHNGAHWCYHTVKGRLPMGKWFEQRVHPGYMTAQLKVLAPSTRLSMRTRP